MPSGAKKPSLTTDPAMWTAKLSKGELEVAGTVTFPTTGWGCAISKAQFRDLNPNYFAVELRYEPPVGQSGDVLTHEPLHLSVSIPPGDEYTDVDVRTVNQEGYDDVAPFLVPITSASSG